jgi:hypothetical protein
MVPKWMLDRLPALTYLLWMLVEPSLHRLKNVLLLPRGDPPLLAGRARHSADRDRYAAAASRFTP